MCVRAEEGGGGMGEESRRQMTAPVHCWAPQVNGLLDTIEAAALETVRADLRTDPRCSAAAGQVHAVLRNQRDGSSVGQTGLHHLFGSAVHHPPEGPERRCAPPLT